MPRRPVPSRLKGPSTRRDAAAAGLSDWHLRHRDVVRLSRDTYLPASDATDLRDRLPAILLTAPPGAVVSHHTAAALWRVEIPSSDRTQPAHLTVPADSRARNRRDRVIHRGELRPVDVTKLWSIPLTTPARTWRDLAGVLAPASLLAVTDQLAEGYSSLQELQKALARLPAGRGASRARAVLPLADALAESPMESVLRWLIHESGLPRPVLQHPIRDASGRVLGRADMAWPAHRLLVEFDGDVHRERDVFVNDLRRQNRLMAEGWVILRFSSADVLGHPEKVIAAIRAALQL
jgi:hypothetical protein